MFPMVSRVDVVEPIASTGPVIPLGLIESIPHGDDEPIPRNPAEVKVEVAEPPKKA